MTLFLCSLTAFGLMMLLLSIGLVVNGIPISGSCGGQTAKRIFPCIAGCTNTKKILGRDTDASQHVIVQAVPNLMETDKHHD